MSGPKVVRVVTREERIASSERLLRQNAAVLLGELRRKAGPEQEELLLALERTAAGDTSAATAEAVLARGFMRLNAGEAAQEPDEAQRELARRLLPEADTGAFESWKAMQAGRIDSRLQEIDRRLAELELLLGAEAAAAFSARLRTIEAEPEGAGRNMRIDALVLDLAQRVRTLRQEAALLREAGELAAELSSAGIDPDDGDIAAKLANAVERRDLAALPSLIERGHALLAGIRRRSAAAARREAILSGLSALGYELRGGMSTALADQGRIVLRKPGLAGYGVEIAAAPDAQRLQVRPVAFAAERDARRDRDAETLWCGDFSKLERLIGAAGGSVTIERDLPPGSPTEDGRRGGRKPGHAGAEDGAKPVTTRVDTAGVLPGNAPSPRT